MTARLRTTLICHHDVSLARVGLVRWLASWSDVSGVIILQEARSRRWTRIRREARRIGWLRLLDVAAFKLYYRAVWAEHDQLLQQTLLSELCQKYPDLTAPPPTITALSPNTPEVEEFLRQHPTDILIAGCKQILKPRIFSLAQVGTFALHPGICPEYRNAHGCFWALANADRERVGMTMLKIDAGIDTGPIYGYFRAPFNELEESHITIQRRMTYGNLDAVAARFQEIAAGSVQPIETTGRASKEWGQPWMSAYLRWKRDARRLTTAGASQTHSEPD